MQPEVSKRKEITKIRVEINEIQSRKKTEKLMTPKAESLKR